MGTKKNVVISDENMEIIKTQFHGEFSHAVNAQFERVTKQNALIRRLAQQLLPDLSEYQWELVLNAVNGTFLDDRHDRGRYRIASDICDDLGVDLLDDCEDTFKQAVSEINALPQLQQFAVMEFSAWFWQRRDRRTPETFLDYIEMFRSER